MGDNSAIEWTDATWTPIRARYWETQNDGSGKERLGWHCEHVSEGCRNCYAERINLRLGTGLEFKPGHLYRPEDEGFCNGETKLFLDENVLTQPLRWKKPRKIFVCSMTDLFADFVPDEWIDHIFTVMALCPQHTFQVLTKRAKRMREYMLPTTDLPILGRLPLERVHFAAQNDDGLWDSLKEYGNLYSLYCSVPWPLPNVWLGVSAEDQHRADERIPLLLDTPAVVRIVSIEPMLGPIDLRKLNPGGAQALDALAGISRDPAYAGWSVINQVIGGGESGPRARPMHPDWPRSLRDQCQAAGVPFFFKQWGEHVPIPLTDNRQIGRGRFYLNGRGYPFHQVENYVVVRVGKRGAGRLLDGIEHNGMPGAA